MTGQALGTAAVVLLLSPLAIAQPAQDSDAVTCRNTRGETAIAACNRAIASRAFSGDALARLHDNRGWAFHGMGQVDRAIADYTEAIRINPSDATIRNNRAIAWYDKGDHDRALADANEAIRLDSRFHFARSVRGLVWHRKGDFDSAIADHTEAIRLDPQDPSARLHRCWTRAAFNRDLQQALADCNEGLRLEPGEPGLFEARAFVHFRMGRMDEALADCERALKQDQQWPHALFVRGLIKLANRNEAGGKADIANAKAIKKDIVEEFARYGIGIETAR